MEHQDDGDRGPERVEVRASAQAIVSLDGRILEVFGFADAQRFHLAFRPRMRLGNRMVTISPEHGGQLSFFYDRDRREPLEAFAALVDAAIEGFDGPTSPRDAGRSAAERASRTHRRT